MLSETGSKDGPVGGRSSRKRRSPWLRKKFLVLSLVGATLVGGGVLLFPQFQEKASAATGDRHFIHIATHGAPLWGASAWLYDGKGKEVYKWNERTKSGGRVFWEFTDGGDGGSLGVVIDGGNFTKELLRTSGLPLDRDHCFLVGAVGDVKYTGDSITGGCTSD